MASESVLRITKEVADIQRGPDLSLAVAFKDENVRRVRALIVGPPDTPYEFGFFEFSIHFSKEYPYKSPQVSALTTNYGKTRFNPNIYGEGKICLSILGTWRGEPGEEWSTAQGLESILISIQSLMSPNPWENEPGFESCKRDSDKKEARLYAAKIKHETLRISIVERLEELLNLPGTLKKEDDSVTFGITDSPEEPYAPFSDLCKRRFLWYYIVYLNTIETEQAKHGSDINDGKAFKLTPFESATNGMSGIYAYSSLKERLNKINDALQQESKDWELEGLRRIDSPVALNFSNRFGRLSKDFTSRCETPVDFALINKNPFAWRITLFGKPMTNLDGGVFNIKIVFSVNFPNLQPRVKVETSLFHQRVSPANGSLCYFPSNPNEPESHVEAIIAAIEDEAPPYDPRTLVNPEASKLRWGSQDDRKTYNRRLRRSAQDSTS